MTFQFQSSIDKMGVDVLSTMGKKIAAQNIEIAFLKKMLEEEKMENQVGQLKYESTVHILEIFLHFLFRN